MEGIFKEILNDNYDKEDIEDILEEYGFPKSGKKDELLQTILKNATIFEDTIKELLDGSSKNEIQIICDSLNIPSKSSRPNLEEKILDKLHENIDNRDIKNKINFLDFGCHKYDLENILAEHNIPSTGKKEKLVERVAKNDSLVKSAMSEWKKELYKEDIEELCDNLGMNSEGNKEKLLQRVNDYVFKKEKILVTNKTLSIDSEKSNIGQKSIQTIVKKNTNYKNKTKNFKKYDSTFLKIIDNIQKEFIPEDSVDEKELQTQLKIFLAREYKGKKIEREVKTSVGNVDFLIDGKYVIEVKLAKTPTVLRDLIGQLEVYQEVFPQIAVLLLNIIEKSDVEKINQYTKRYAAKGIPAIIVDGRTRRSSSRNKIKIDIETS